MLLPTLLIEGVLLLAFGYRSRRSLLVFLLVNLVTQGGFALYLAVTVLNHGVSGWSLLFYLPIELIIMVVELLAYRRLLTEKSRGRAVGYAVAANVCSAVVGLLAHRPAVAVHRQHFLGTILRPARARKRKEFFSWRPKSYTMPTPF